MSEQKKEGLFKRIFGGSKGCNCGVQVQEVPEAPAEKEVNPNPQSPCCASSDTKGDQK